MTLQTAEYSNFFETTLDGNVAGGDTTITLSALPTSDGTTYIDAPYYLVIDPDSTTNREVINVTSHNTGTLQITCTRDVEGRHSPDIPHDTGTTVRMSVVGEMFEDLHDRLNDVALTGDVTGTISSSTQDVATTITGLDATKIADGSVTSTEFQYIGGLTSDAQTQLDAKLAHTGGTLTDLTETVQAVTSTSGNVDVDLASGNVATITLTEAITSIDFTNVPTSGVAVAQLIITQDASSAYGVTLSVTVNGAGAVTANTSGNGGFTMSTTLSTVDIVTFLFVNGGTPHVTFLQDMRNS